MVLAAGLGTRMRRAAEAAGLSEAQQAAAGRGLKAMIPVGRPFLDYVLSGLADAGYARVCLVIGGGEAHGEIRRYYSGSGQPTRVALEFAVQRWPLGTADAVLAAEPFAAGEPVVVLNADNLYPRQALAALRGLPRAGLLGFRRSTLLRDGSIPAERITAFALLEVDPEGELRRIVEKPNPEEAGSFGPDPWVSMNAWLLPPTIYAACRAIRPSPRGELELQDAVRHSIELLGERYRVLPAEQAVLDLSI
ncbi:MAG TPA: sugar phosphate nucleotidyltransferase, partial [Gemmatimonadales bacterium]|nr:sugar phosphate nucleotidyltransferase [Gemmatimonadales bacterium]